MSKKEILCNISDTETVKLNNAISSIKLAQDVIAKGTIEHGNAIAHTVWENIRYNRKRPWFTY